MFLTGGVIAILIVQSLRQIGSIVEYFIKVYSRRNARSEIIEKATVKNPKITSILVKFKEREDTYKDEQDFVVEGYDSGNNHIANINVTAPTRTGI